MQQFGWVIAALFLPLFPLGMIFNAIFQRTRLGWLRAILLLMWPLPGILIMQDTLIVIPGWLIYWALFSALLYGFRAVVVKEFGIWTGFLATSTWSLGWIVLRFGAEFNELVIYVLAFSLPLSLLILLVAELEKRYESAYVSVISGLAQAQPRLAVLTVIALLAAIGSPLFPAFFSMLDIIAHVISVLPVIAFGLVTVWLLWSWSGISLLQQLLVGPESRSQYEDIGQGGLIMYSASLLLLIVAGLYFSRILL